MIQCGKTGITPTTECKKIPLPSKKTLDRRIAHYSHASRIMELTKGEVDQYQRHLSLKNFGLQKQLKLKESSVLVVGAGGLGCPALQYLSAAGVGKIGIIDDDVIDSSNLQRQILFTHEDIGLPKAQKAAERLSLSNPHIQIKAYVERLTAEIARNLFQDYDVIVDGTDNFLSRYLINDACILFDKPLIHGSINQFDGMVSVFNLNGGPTYRCLFPEQPDPSSIPSCAEAGVLGVLPGIIGCWQAMEAIKVLTEIGSTLSGKLLMYNALSQVTRVIKIDPTPQSREIEDLSSTFETCSPHSCSSSNDIIEISSEELAKMIKAEEVFQLLDVRESWERSQSRILSSLHQPLGELINSSVVSPHKDLNRSINLVIYCKAGIRSRMACEALKSIGFTRLYNLSGGMDDWGQSHPELCQSD